MDKTSWPCGSENYVYLYFFWQQKYWLETERQTASGEKEEITVEEEQGLKSAPKNPRNNYLPNNFYIIHICVCPRSLDSFYILSYYLNESRLLGHAVWAPCNLFNKHLFVKDYVVSPRIIKILASLISIVYFRIKNCVRENKLQICKTQISASRYLYIHI